MNLLRKDMEEQAFFLEIQRLSIEMDAIIDKYDMRDRVVSVTVTGLIDHDMFGETRVKAIYSYSLDSEEELNNIIDFINNTWENVDGLREDEDIDLDDLLGGTGIELED